MWLKRDLFFITKIIKSTQDEYFSSSIICVEVNETTDQGGKRKN